MYCLLMLQYVTLFIAFQMVLLTKFSKNYVLTLLYCPQVLHFDIKVDFLPLIVTLQKLCRENRSLVLGSQSTFGSASDEFEKLWLGVLCLKRRAAEKPSFGFDREQIPSGSNEAYTITLMC